MTHVNDGRPGSGYEPPMELLSNARLALQPARSSTGSEDESSVLVLVQGRIVAILVRLDAPFHREAQGRWYLEVGFGRCAGTPAPFERLSDGLRWIGQRLDEKATALADLLAEADRVFIRAAGDGTGALPPPSA